MLGTSSFFHGIFVLGGKFVFEDSKEIGYLKRFWLFSFSGVIILQDVARI